jgi:hypothetical protein
LEDIESLIDFNRYLDDRQNCTKIQHSLFEKLGSGAFRNFTKTDQNAGRESPGVSGICRVNNLPALPVPVYKPAPRERCDMRRQSILPYLKRLGNITRRHAMTLAHQQLHHLPACRLAKGAKGRDGFQLIHASGIIDMNDSRVTIH